LFLVHFAAQIPAFAKDLSEQEVKAFEERASDFHQGRNYAKALEVAEQWVKAAEKIESPNLGAGTATALGNAAWYALFAKRPERALAASERALALRPKEL
jgi:hypothetical protein